jgi:DNA primase
MGIVDEDVVRVRESTDIVKLITEHTQLKKVGRRWQGLCPFHNEKTPSFSVNAEEGLYYCFGCQKSGDAITFVQEMEHADFAGSVESLARRAGIQLRYTSASEGESRKRRTRLIDAVGKAVEWYHQRLLEAPDAAKARGYLRSRGFDGEMVRRYKIGWAPDEWDALVSSLDLSESVAKDAGLGFKNRAGRMQDSFRDRLLFPIYDHNDSPVGFGGRILPGGEGPKYKNSYESPIYAKSKLLYGLNWAKEDIVRADEAIVCEGYTDVIGFAHAGLDRAVATCGTALTDEHVALLRRFSRRLVLAFDADAAGQAAAERFYEWEKQHELEVAVAALPIGVDPGELAQSDPEALRKAIDEALPFLGFRVARVLTGSDLSTPERRARVAEAAVAVVREHPSPLVRDQYVMDIADRCRVDPDRLRVLLAGQSRPAPERAEGESAQGSRPVTIEENIETLAVRLAIHAPDELPDFVIPELFAAPRERALFELVSAHGTLAEAIDAVPSELSEALGQLTVLDQPDDAAEAIATRLLHDAAVRELHMLEAQGRETGDLELAKTMAELQRGIEQVRSGNWQVDDALLLLDWLQSKDEHE